MTAQLIASTLRVSTPLIFAALGGMFSERSGVINIALEGMMLIGAFGAAVGTFASHSPWLGAVCGMAAGAAFAAIYGLFVIRWRADQIVAGTAINMLAMGLTPVFCKILYDVTGSTPAIPIRAAVFELGARGRLFPVDEVHAERTLDELCRRTSRGARRCRHPRQPRP